MPEGKSLRDQIKEVLAQEAEEAKRAEAEAKDPLAQIRRIVREEVGSVLKEVMGAEEGGEEPQDEGIMGWLRGGKREEAS